MQRFHSSRKTALVASIVLAVLVGLIGFSSVLLWFQPKREVTSSLIMAGNSSDASLAVARAVNQGAAPGFARVTGPRQLTFPADHGPHPEYQTEWWYYTGNLQGPDGHQFGYQLTFFRRGLVASAPQRTSKWATRDVYFAHFAVTDVAGNQFMSTPQVARGGEIGLAGAVADPYRVFVGNWEASGTGDTVTLRATTEKVAINLNLQAAKSMTLQGNYGYSPKSTGVGEATYYYSYTRMKTVGAITINGTQTKVEGLSWFDHEFGTNFLGPEQIGWDWFGLHLMDGRDLMVGRVRRKDGGFDIIGSITGVKDTVPQLYLKDVRLTTLTTWVSPRTQIRYPSRWRLEIPAANIDVTIEPLLTDQELIAGLVYWEGAVKVSGRNDGNPVLGAGYVELTGYADAKTATHSP